LNSFNFNLISIWFGENSSIIHSWETVIASTERAAKIHGETAKKVLSLQSK